MVNLSMVSAQDRRRNTRLQPGWLPHVISGFSKLSPSLASKLFAFLFTRPAARKLQRQERNWLLSSAARPLSLPSGQEVPLYEWRALPSKYGVLDEAPVPTILLVHGFGGSAGQMGGFAAPLIAAGYRVISFDMPAHGAAAGSRSSLPEMIETLLEVAGRVGPLEGIIGHSAGASAVIAALHQGLRAERVVLVAPMPDLESFMQRLAAQLGFTERVAKLAQRRIEARHGIEFSKLKAQRLVQGLSLPALILQDSADQMAPLSEVETLTEAWPSATLELSAGLGHARILQDSSTIAKATTFFGDPTLR